MDYVIADAVINGLSKAITSSQIKIDKSLSEKMDFFMTRLIVAASKPNLLAVYNRFLETIDASTDGVDPRPRPPYWNVTGRVRCCEVGDPV